MLCTPANFGRTKNVQQQLKNSRTSQPPSAAPFRLNHLTLKCGDVMKFVFDSQSCTPAAAAAGQLVVFDRLCTPAGPRAARICCPGNSPTTGWCWGVCHMLRMPGPSLGAVSPARPEQVLNSRYLFISNWVLARGLSGRAVRCPALPKTLNSNRLVNKP